MQVIADLQLHSKYARAVSQEMVIPKIREWAKRKGIGLIATGDWTHPLWMREIKAHLEEMGNGLLQLKPNTALQQWSGEEGPLFLLATEVSSIYSQGGKVRRVHTLIWVNSFESADKINKELITRGANLIADGRPIIGLSSIQVAELVFSIDQNSLVIPAHAWTPWYSLYGSESGFDSIDECFGPFAKHIYAIETGLSSDPAMNWRIKELDNRSIISFSDAHSGPKLGREATVFELEELSYMAIREAIMAGQGTTGSTSTTSITSCDPSRGTRDASSARDTSRIAYTIEFHPEEGKYHYTGHRNCGIKQTPQETRTKGTVCPVCGKKLTVGVMHRVDQLADRSEEELQLDKKKIPNLSMIGIYSQAFPKRSPYVMTVPLLEILSEVIGGLPTSQRIQNEYKNLTDNFECEFNVLLRVSPADIEKIAGPKVAQAIEKVRNGDIVVDPGYDGVFGVVNIFSDKIEEARLQEKEQLNLF